MKAGRWVPNPGERYYYISHAGSVASTRCGQYASDFIYRWKSGNCYKNYSTCKEVLRRQLTKLGIQYTEIGGKISIPSGLNCKQTINILQ